MQELDHHRNHRIDGPRMVPASKGISLPLWRRESLRIRVSQGAESPAPDQASSAAANPRGPTMERKWDDLAKIAAAAADEGNFDSDQKAAEHFAAQGPGNASEQGKVTMLRKAIKRWRRTVPKSAE